MAPTSTAPGPLPRADPPTSKTQLILITDLYEGGDKEQLLARAAQVVDSGVSLIVLLALNDAGRPGYDPSAQHFAALGLRCSPARRTCSPS